MIEQVDQRDLAQALDLVNRVFTEFVAHEYSAKGQASFRSYLEHKYEEVSQDLLTGQKKMWAYYENGKIIGVIAIRNTSHISLMFVEKAHQKKGIARKLFQIVLDEVMGRGDIDAITVNSSPYAAAVYGRLGFVKTGDEQENDGIRYIPMERLL